MRCPGDKSISHRAAIMAAMAEGRDANREFRDECGLRVNVEMLAANGSRSSTRRARLFG